jgi:hypothetical protein
MRSSRLRIFVISLLFVGVLHAHEIPQAQIVRIAQADHYVFQSHEADVLREMNSFIGGLQASHRAVNP